MSYRSVFEQKYDVAIYGCGYAGLAAARALVAAGKRVLLFDRRPDVVWESGRSFAPHAGDESRGDASHGDWREFLRELQERNLYADGMVDGAGAEVLAAAWLRAHRSRLQTLLNAWPVEAVVAGEQLRSLTVATKGGLRSLQAEYWVDASDEASLFRLVFPQLAAWREPSWFEQRAILFQENRAAVENIVPAQFTETLSLERRLWKNELAFCVRAQAPHRLPALLKMATEARAALDAPLCDSPLVAFSVAPLPVYEASTRPPVAQRGNLIAASPALSERKIDTLGARFRLGVEAAARWQDIPFPAAASAASVVRRWPSRRMSCDVFVAGAGTSGALAALAAQRSGAQVLCSDAASFAGGVGSGGQINGYFHGQPGGLFEELDARAQQVGQMLNPAKPARSHETKKIAFEESFTPQNSGCFLPETLPFEVSLDGRRIVSLKLVAAQEIIEVEPQAVVDCTGDGDVAALAGGAFDFGRREDGFPLSYSQPCLNVRGSAVRGANFDAGWVDPTDPEDWTRARLTAIAQYSQREFSDDSHLILLAPILGLRQSRQIKTTARLSLDDIISHRQRPDSIGLVRSPLDTHSIDYEFEDDETLFWLWGCKSFRESTHADMPYGMLVPEGFTNLWIACRASGLTPPAAYAARMQRDMQRVGEAAGYAAALAVQHQTDALHVPQEQLREKLRQSGAFTIVAAEETDTVFPSQFDSGIPGAYLWPIYRNRDRFEGEVLQRLSAGESDVSWLAAVVLAMWNDPRAEPRLLEALENDEAGVETPSSARGPFGQWIDVPNWFLAVNLLRRCGSRACLAPLRRIAARPGNVLNLRTSIALTLARLAERLDEAGKAEAATLLPLLVADAVPDACVRPSRSIQRTLRGEPQQPLPQEPEGVDTREDHGWRLDFAVTKAARALEVETPVDVTPHLADERALVRAAFRSIESG